MEPDSVQIRVLGCLIEKQHTTPGQYPLTLNSLRLACNQATNRDPVVDYDEATIRAALEHLAARRWARTTSTHGSRAAKYRHLLKEAFELPDEQLSMLAVLMLRGPQTPGELKQHTERMRHFETLEDLERVLGALIDRGLVARLKRRPGQKEQRFRQLLGGGEDELESEREASGSTLEEELPERGEDRLERLEREVTELRAEVAALKDALGG